MQEKYTVTFDYNIANINTLNYNIDYVKNDLHSLCLTYGYCTSRYYEYAFDNGHKLMKLIDALYRFYPSLPAMLTRFYVLNKAEEGWDALKFIA